MELLNMKNNTKIIIISCLLTASLLMPPSILADSLAWDANTDQTDGYKIHYSTDQDNLSQVIDVGTATTYVLDNMPLSEGIPYYFAVSAYNSAGESPLSQVLMYQPPDTTPPNIPTGLQAIIP
jgi:hypothetical protein